MNADLDRLVASIAPRPGPGMTPGARELLREITDTVAREPEAPPVAAPARRRIAGLVSHGRRGWANARRPPGSPLRRLRLVAPLAFVMVLTTWLLPSTAVLGPGTASALDIKRVADTYHVVVADVFASPERYERELRAVHLNIRLSTEPVAASLVGYILTGTDEITALAISGRCRPAARTGRCRIGLRIPVRFTGRAHVILGREARPGEVYRGRESLAAPGEPLRCVPFVNQTVATVVRALRGRGVGAVTFASSGRVGTAAPDSWFVRDGVTSGPGSAILLVDPAPGPDPEPVGAGCAPRS
ncbi:hypothetical protein [Sphaerisporangium sp. TRM90804]|uniref:hypothetical protein n=1 Tax=Sphaerisporangium sp. TRM90804 TaxID=3031113 RepID=UPI0024494591|nr:hypothetical protein [Sphaerisporangium sp. TRM90804]MDH2429437.1 hypothetical protein [Sphaerisporangium sp. TRM90804]